MLFPTAHNFKRVDSLSSMGSVDTIEGLSLDFQMAIQMGEESLSPDLDEIEGSRHFFLGLPLLPYLFSLIIDLSNYIIQITDLNFILLITLMNIISTKILF